jgi:diacylglycerol kinase family enzyme
VPEVASSSMAPGGAVGDARTTWPRHARRSGSSLLLVANANASGVGGRTETVDQAASLLRRFGARVETSWTGSAAEVDEVVSEEERRVVLLGGDGTLHAVANIQGHRPEVGLLPRGRANNIAHALGVPLELTAAARLAVQGRARSIDGIAVETPELAMTALEGISVGFHATARARYRGVNSADTAAGVAAALRAFAHFEPVSVALEIDGVLELRRLGQLFVVNFPFFGPRLPVAPAADPSDNALELVEFAAGTRRRLLPALAHLRRGTHLGRNGVRLRTARRIRIATKGRSPVVADTTVLTSCPVELAVRPQALQLVTPAG